MYFVNRCAVVLKPTQIFLDWVNHLDDDLNLTLPQLHANCTVFLIPEFDTPEEAVAYFDERYKEIFVAELSSWTLESSDYPKDLSLENFWRNFELDVHDTVVDLSDDEIENEHLMDSL